MSDHDDRPHALNEDFPPDLVLSAMAPWEQHIWQTPGLTIEQRRAAIHFLRVYRGDLDDDDAVDGLFNALATIMKDKGRLRRDWP